MISQPASAIDPDTGEVYVPDPVTATLDPAFSPGARSFETTLPNAYAKTTVRYRARSRDAVVLGVDTEWAAEEAPVAVAAFARGTHPTFLANGDFEAAAAYWDDVDVSAAVSAGERKRRRELLQVLGDVTDLEVDLAVGATVVRWNISAASAEDGDVTTAYALTIRRLTGSSGARLAGVTIRATSPSGDVDEEDVVTTAGVVVSSADPEENGSSGFDAAHTTYELDQILPYDAETFTAEVAFASSSEVLLATMRVTSSASADAETILELAHFSNDANGQTESVPLTSHFPETDLIAIRVLTKDGRTTETYTVRVSRAAPPGPPPPRRCLRRPCRLAASRGPVPGNGAAVSRGQSGVHALPAGHVLGGARRSGVHALRARLGDGDGARAALRFLFARLFRQERGVAGVFAVSPRHVRRRRRVGDVRAVRGGHHQREHRLERVQRHGPENGRSA